MALENFRILAAGGADPFSALNAQRFAYDQTNLQTEAGNLARVAAAQEAANRWFSESARLQEAAKRSEDYAQAQAAQNALAIASQRMQIQANERMAKERAAVDREQIAQRDREFQRQLDLNENALRFQRQQSDEVASTLGPQVAQAGRDYDQAEKSYRDLMASLSTLPTTLMGEYGIPNVAFDRRNQQFFVPPKADPRVFTPDLLENIRRANERLATESAKLEAAQRERDYRFGVFNMHVGRKDPNLVPFQRGGRWFLKNTLTGKEYGEPTVTGVTSVAGPAVSTPLRVASTVTRTSAPLAPAPAPISTPPPFSTGIYDVTPDTSSPAVAPVSTGIYDIQVMP